MRANFGGSGIVINLNSKDEKIIEKYGKVVCNLPEWKKPRLVFHVVEKVPKQGFLEEPGFHIKAKPSKKGPEFRHRYDVYVSKKRFQKMISEADIIHGGYFASRSMYDRVDINYWPI